MALLSAGRYQEAVTRLKAEKDATRRAENWDWYAERCIERAEVPYDERDYERALSVLDSALAALQGTEGAQSAAAAYLWAWKAVVHRQLEQYSEVLDAYEAAIRLYEALKENGPHVAYCYKNAAQVFIRRQDHRTAEQYLQAALRSDTTGYYQLSIYAQLVNNAYWQNNLEAALRYAAVGMVQKGPPEARASLLSASAQVYRRQGQWAEAQQRLSQALAYYQTQPDEEENTIRCLTGLADVAAQTGRPAQAEAYFKQAEKLGLRIFKRGHSREMIKLYCEWGDWAMRYRGPKTALSFYQKAIQQAFPSLNSDDLSRNPGAAVIPAEPWAMNALARKAKALLLQPTPQARHTAAQCLDLALAVAERLRNTYGTDEAKLYFVEHNFDLLREAIRNEWALYQGCDETQHLERLFDLLERGRANALRDALYQQRALALAEVPHSLLRQEEALRRERAATQAAQIHAESRGDTAAANRCQTTLFYLERRYAEVLRQLRAYPRFREYTQADRRAALSEVQQALPDTAALLLYFDAGDRYVGLAVLRQRLWAWDVPRDLATDSAVVYLCSTLPDKRRLEAEPNRFFEQAYMLRQRLLPDTVLNSCRSVVIVPDGLLAYMPFEVLLLRPHTGAYATAPYLLRALVVRYTWSASFVADERTAPATKAAQLLQIAPFAASGQRGLSALPFSREEHPAGIVANVLLDKQATAAAFQNAGAHYDVLHLSTHAHAGSQETAGVEFYDRTLALPEIYAQRLKTSLVALSACQTNTGAFTQGEGVLSLARAFAYAGARSLVASYWSVNDRSTAQLFTHFYQCLRQGLPKSEALRRARLGLLSEPGPDARKSPYHWAAFTLTGADGTVTFATQAPPVWLWAGGAVAFGFVVLWIVRRSCRKNYGQLSVF